MEQSESLMLELTGRMGRRLSKGQRKIAEYIATHYETAVFMTASSLGEQVGVSESTVVRFALAIGYDGYPAFQKALQKMVKNRLTSVQRMEMGADLTSSEVIRQVLKNDIQNIRQTLEDIDLRAFENALSAIDAAKHIYIVGVRSSSMLAEVFGYYLGFIYDHVTVASPGLSEVIEQISRVSPDDVLVAISFPRYSNRTLDAMEYAKTRGADILGITDSNISPLYQASDICLTAKGDMAGFADSLVAPLSLLYAIIVALSQRHKEQLGERLSQMERIWTKHRVYNVGKDDGEEGRNHA